MVLGARHGFTGVLNLFLLFLWVSVLLFECYFLWELYVFSSFSTYLERGYKFFWGCALGGVL